MRSRTRGHEDAVLEQRPAPALGAAEAAEPGTPVAAAPRQRGPEADGGTRVRRSGVKRQATARDRSDSAHVGEARDHHPDRPDHPDHPASPDAPEAVDTADAEIPRAGAPMGTVDNARIASTMDVANAADAAPNPAEIGRAHV